VLSLALWFEKTNALFASRITAFGAVVETLKGNNGPPDLALKPAIKPVRQVTRSLAEEIVCSDWRLPCAPSMVRVRYSA
jgi:hypothetical protein